MLSRIKALMYGIPFSFSMHMKREKSIWLFGAWFGKKYSDNSRCLYEYVLKDCPDIKAYWVTHDSGIYKKLKTQGLPVVKSISIKGFFLQLHASVAVYCTGSSDLMGRLLGGAVHINLWHGVGGGKKIGYDAGWFGSKFNEYITRIESQNENNKYMLCTSEEMEKVFSSAFRIKKTQFIYAGQPRNDIFFDENYNSKLLTIKKKIILYMPTHRQEGKKKINCNRIFDLSRVESFCKKNNCVFVIKKHYYHRAETENLKQYKHIYDWTTKNIDPNLMLLYSSCLVSDYSSVTADYLLLNRPIFYYCYDINDYVHMDRELYWKYEDITPGPKVYSFEELLSSLKQVMEQKIDVYESERKRVRDMFYDPDKSQKKASPIIVDRIKEIIDINNI